MGASGGGSCSVVLETPHGASAVNDVNGDESSFRFGVLDPDMSGSRGVPRDLRRAFCRSGLLSGIRLHQPPVEAPEGAGPGRPRLVRTQGPSQHGVGIESKLVAPLARSFRPDGNQRPS